MTLIEKLSLIYAQPLLEILVFSPLRYSSVLLPVLSCVFGPADLFVEENLQGYAHSHTKEFETLSSVGMAAAHTSLKREHSHHIQSKFYRLYPYARSSKLGKTSGDEQ